MNIRKIIQTIPIICGLSGLSDAASSIIMPQCSKSGPYKITTNSGDISRPYSGFGLNTIKIPGKYSLPDVKAIVDPCGNRIQPLTTELSSPLSSKTSIFSGRWDAGSIITFPNLPASYSGKEVFFNSNEYKFVIISGVPAIKIKPEDKIKYTTGQYYIPSVNYTGTIAGVPNGGNVFSGENLPSCNPGTLCFSVNSSQELIVASEKNI